MKKFLAAGLIAGSLAAATAAHAVPQIGIQIYVDGVLDASLAPTAGGTVSLTDTTNPYFSSITVSSLGVPATVDPNFGTITINASSSFTSGTHTLALVTTQTGLSGLGYGGLANTFTFNGLFNSAKITSAIGSNYIDTNNTAFARTTLIASTPDVGGQVSYSSATMNYFPIPSPLFSETEVFAFTFKGQAMAESSVQITGVPEPVSLALMGTGLMALGTLRSRRTKV